MDSINNSFLDGWNQVYMSLVDTFQAWLILFHASRWMQMSMIMVMKE